MQDYGVIRLLARASGVVGIIYERTDPLATSLDCHKIDRRYSRRSVVSEFHHRTSLTNRESLGSMAKILNPFRADLSTSQYALLNK